jgi:RNA recognition motif-containing protein
MIHSSNPKKSRKGMTTSEVDDEVAEKVFDPEIDQDPYDNEDEVIPSEKVARQMKKQEIKNIKKKVAEKGVSKEGDEKVVIVKNLPIKVKRQAIHRLFAKYGPIESVWLRCAALVDPAMPKKVAVIKQQFHPDRQPITAFDHFKEVESAQQALAATGILFQEQHISVNLLTDSTNQRIGTSIFVGNLPFGIEDEALWNHFGQCGTIKDVRIIRDSTNGLGKGFGYVNFDSPDAVELALRLNESDLNGRSLRVTRCKKNPKPKAAPVAAKDKTKGAYKRVQDKQTKQDRSKSSGWISKMKQRQKQSQHQQGGQVQSFAGETTSTNNKVHFS